jgi:DNA polymerase II small subunit
MITAIFQKESPSFEQSQMVVTDEVLGITGMSDGGGRIFAKSLLWPDLPNQSQALEPSSGEPY